MVVKTTSSSSCTGQRKFICKKEMKITWYYRVDRARAHSFCLSVPHSFSFCVCLFVFLSLSIYIYTYVSLTHTLCLFCVQSYPALSCFSKNWDHHYYACHFKFAVIRKITFLKTSLSSSSVEKTFIAFCSILFKDGP